MKLLVTSLVSIVALTSCQRDSDYYYFIPPLESPKKVASPVKIKELVGNSQVDVLWVVDNSGSMGQYQRSVINNASQFIDKFVQKPGLEWAMGLVSTDTDESPYLGLIPNMEFNWKTTNPVFAFNNAVRRLGTNGSAYEQPLDATYNALAMYPNFLRPNAVFVLIILTDAPEQSTHTSAPGLLSYLTTLKGGAIDKIKTYAIIAPRESGCYTQEGTFYYRNSDYEYLVTQTNGAYYPICAPDYGVTLSEIGNQIVSKIERPRIYLPKRPNPKTIKVFHKGVELPGDLPDNPGYWIYDVQDNAIVFTDLSFAPGNNEEVEITYEEETPIEL